MGPSVAIPAAFWLFAETTIVVGLAATTARVARGSWRTPAWLFYAAFFLAGCALLSGGPRRLAPRAPFETAALVQAFGKRFAWNLVCAQWIVLEWSMLFYLLRLADVAGRRFLGRGVATIPAWGHVAGYVVVLSATVGYHLAAPRAAETLEEFERFAHLYVRLAGFCYIALEAGIAWALWRGRRVLAGLVERVEA